MGDRPGRKHDPDRARLIQLAHEIGEIPARRRPFIRQTVHRVSALIVDDAAMAGMHQPPHDVSAHPAEADHPELHDAFSIQKDRYDKACSRARPRAASPAPTSAGRWTRMTRRPRSARTSKSPRAW